VVHSNRINTGAFAQHGATTLEYVILIAGLAIALFVGGQGVTDPLKTSLECSGRAMQTAQGGGTQGTTIDTRCSKPANPNAAAPGNAAD
jgi:Flp pilus assembly pilin Flp